MGYDFYIAHVIWNTYMLLTPHVFHIIFARLMQYEIHIEWIYIETQYVCVFNIK